MKPCDSCIDYDDWHGGCGWCKKHEYGLHQTIEAASIPNPVVTNYDRLISKTPEELAEWIESIEPAARLWRDDHGDDCTHTDCVSCWLDWLKSPVEVDT